MIGANINAYFKAAMSYPIERLAAVMQGKDNSIPQAAAMMALQIKKPMVDAMKGQEAQQQPPQPSVKEQMAQEVSMLPENTGIMNLPAPNMAQVGEQAMAAGGIVAFAEGGLSKEELAELERRERGYFSGLWDSTKDYVRGMGETLANTPWESKNPHMKYKTPKYTGIMEYERPAQKLERLRTEDPNYAPPVSGTYPEEFQRGTAAGIKPDPTAFIYAGTPAPDGVQKMDATAGRSSSSGVGIGALPDLKGTQRGDVEAEYRRMQRLLPDAEKKYGDLEKEVDSQYAKLKEERDRTKPQGKAQEALEKQLEREEAEGKGKEERNINMSLINAGLAMMGGKSQYALQNIAEGAQVGTKQYQAGLDKLEEAAKERRRLAASIEEARRAEARGDWKDENAFRKEAMDAKLGMRKAQIDAVMKLSGDTLKSATDRVDTLDTLRSAEERTRFTGGIQLQTAAMARDADMARVRAMNDQNETQKMLLAQQRGETSYNNFINSPEGKALSAQAISNPEASQKLAELQEYFVRRAYETAGLKYVPQGAPNTEGFKVIGVKN